MKLAAAALTTDGSESLATDTSGIVVPSHGQGRVAIAQPRTGAALAPEAPAPLLGIQPAAGAEASRTNHRLATMVY